MEKVCVIIRVYNRITDLEYNLEIIRKTWTQNDYYVIVSSNGEEDGYVLTDNIYKLSNKIVKANGNSGHLKGNSLLLLQAIPYIPNDCEYTLLLEADTWLYKDRLICKYIKILRKKESVWASAKWYDRYYSLATDFAIVNSSYIKSNKELLDFGNFPEPFVANYLIDNRQSFVYIKENMMPMVPSYLKKYLYAPKGRFYMFPSSKMATHHIEDLKNGMNQKLRDFNILSNNFFSEEPVIFPKIRLIFVFVIFYFSFIFIRRSWFSRINRFTSF